MPKITAIDALERLRAGNRRFLAKLAGGEAEVEALRGGLPTDQEPFAIMLGCSDSRVPPEIVFDQWLGDLFIIRVAGNLVAPHQFGSIEFAAEHLGTRLVVVLGHTRCSAVTATADELEKPSDPSPGIASIVDDLRPSVEPLVAAGAGRDEVIRRAVRENVAAMASQLRTGSGVIEKLIATDDLVVVGAEYSLDTGGVDFFDGIPEAD